MYQKMNTFINKIIVLSKNTSTQPTNLNDFDLFTNYTIDLSTIVLTHKWIIDLSMNSSICQRVGWFINGAIGLQNEAIKSSMNSSIVNKWVAHCSKYFANELYMSEHNWNYVVLNWVWLLVDDVWLILTDVWWGAIVWGATVWGGYWFFMLITCNWFWFIFQYVWLIVIHVDLFLMGCTVSGATFWGGYLFFRMFHRFEQMLIDGWWLFIYVSWFVLICMGRYSLGGYLCFMIVDRCQLILINLFVMCDGFELFWLIFIDLSWGGLQSGGLQSRGLQSAPPIWEPEIHSLV